MKSFDVIFLSYDEPNAEANWKRLLNFAPFAKRVSGVKGIYNAFVRCAEVAEHDRFYLVDADSWILDDFRFGDPTAEFLSASVCIWLARNPVNGIAHPNGGVKLLSKAAVDSMRPDALDEISSAGRIKIIPVAAAENRFNSSPFLAWRAGFRECTKIATAMFTRRPELRNELLRLWQTRGADQPNGLWAMAGARDGAAYGFTNRGEKESLLRINDMDWLRKRFEREEKKRVRTIARLTQVHVGQPPAFRSFGGRPS